MTDSSSSRETDGQGEEKKHKGSKPRDAPRSGSPPQDNNENEGEAEAAENFVVDLSKIHLVKHLPKTEEELLDKLVAKHAAERTKPARQV